MNSKERAFLDKATRVLLSGDVTKLANKRRAVIEDARKPKGDVLAEQLPHALKSAEEELLPQLASLRSESLIPPNAFNNLGRVWIACFLREAEGTKQSLRKLASKHAKLLLAEAKEESFVHRFVIPLLKFSAARAFRFKGTANSISYNCRITKTHPMNHHLLGFHCFITAEDIRSPMRDMPDIAEWAMILDQRVAKNWDTYPAMGSIELQGIQDGLFTAFRLCKAGDLRWNRTYISRSLLTHSGGLAFTSRSPRHWGFGEAYVLAETEILQFKKIWRSLERYLPFKEKLPPRLAIALEYFNSSYDKDNPSRLLDLSIAIETLFGLGGEQTYRLPIRVANLLGRNRNEAQSVFDSVGSVYKTRSKIVHGNVKLLSQPSRNGISEAAKTLRELVRRAILAHLDLFAKLGRDSKVYNRLIEKDFERERVITRGLR